MIFSKSNILIGTIICLCISFALCEINEMYFISSISKSFIVPLFTLLYIINVKRKSTYFFWFLILFSVSELTIFAEYYIDSDSVFEIYYMIGNLLYILAYILLTLEVCKSLDFKKVFKNYKVHLFILTLLNIYMVYVLITIVNPYLIGSVLIVFELIYNIVMLVLLTLSLIAYFYNDNIKSLSIFLGSLCIVFSEVIQIAYYYITDQDFLNFISTILFVLAFCFYYYYSRISFKKDLKAVI